MFQPGKKIALFWDIWNVDSTLSEIFSIFSMQCEWNPSLINSKEYMETLNNWWKVFFSGRAKQFPYIIVDYKKEVIF